jgi:hypothetical protein
MKTLTILLCLLSITLSTIGADETLLEKNVKRILDPAGYPVSQQREYLKNYMQPFVTAFGTCMGGAMYHRASVKSLPRFDAGISFVLVPVPDKGKTCLDPGGQEVASVFGKTSETAIIGGTGVSTLFVPQLHLNLGLFENFELTVKYLGFSMKEFGDISLWGIGIKYGLIDLIPIPAFPLDVSIQAMLHNFKLGNWIDAGTFGMNLQVSKSFPLFPLGIYGGIGIENSSLTIETDEIMDAQTGIGDVSIDGENSFRLTFGLSYSLAIFTIHADYNIGEYKSVGLGAMITL